jgi:hypothetical protein
VEKTDSMNSMNVNVILDGSHGKLPLLSWRPRVHGRQIQVVGQSLHRQYNHRQRGMRDILKFASMNSMRGFWPGVPSKIARVLIVRGA